uniref:Uncharacterized protein n=1 Tax=Anguilla anguilla TaxID=7936 RepID=A0A0E9XLC2_ANGAN
MMRRRIKLHFPEGVMLDTCTAPSTFQ